MVDRAMVQVAIYQLSTISYPDEPLNPAKNHENLQKKLRLDFGVWIQDGLRHSFGTYYHNLIRSIPEVV